MTYNPLHEAVTTIPEFRPRKIKPGKKAVYVAIFLSAMLLMSQVFTSSLRQSKPSHVSVSRVYGPQYLSLNELVERPSCMKTFLGIHRPPVKDEGTCQHISPPRGFCSLLQELFSKKPDKCSKMSVTFCSQKSGIVKCEIPSVCLKQEVFIGEFSPLDAGTHWKPLNGTTLNLAVKNLVRKSNFQGYIFLGCNSINRTNNALSLQFTQLFVAPPRIQSKSTERSKQKPSINLVMIDSVSRNHFYRSLPSAVDTLESLKSKKKVEVLDFSYLQAITHKTFENLQALLAGFVDLNQTDIREDNPGKSLPVDELFGRLQDRGYHTYWLEDFCWKYKHGLHQYLNIKLDSNDTWSQYKKAITQASIDSLGISLSSCSILEANGRTDPSHNSSSICYNGKYHHTYLLEYLELLQKSAMQNNDPLFAFTHLNVGHDYTGVRIQTLDESLRTYLEHASTLSDTLTVVFSNHGNNNGLLVESSSEGYIEAFNPFMFILVPPGIASRIGHVRMEILKDNQDKLVTLLDVHSFLTHLLDVKLDYEDKDFEDSFVSEGGIVSSISDTRNCNDLPLVTPNLCICRGFDIHVPPSEVHNALADFAVGTLNNLILHQRYRGGKRGFGPCQILRVSGVRNAHELRMNADTIQYKLDVDVMPLGVTRKGAKETFFFVVEVGPSSPSIKLLSYDRISAYKFYGSCRDRSVDLKLCICDVSNSNSFDIPFISSLTFVPSSLTSFLFAKPTNSTIVRQHIKAFVQQILPPGGQSSIDYEYPTRLSCVFIIKHTFNVGFNLYAMSACANLHKVIVRIQNDDFYLSDKPVTRHIIHFNEAKLLISGLQKDEETAKLKYEIDIVPWG